MPLYEYQCEACGHRFEAIQRFSDPPLEECPKCGGRVHKLQSAPAFQFKGSGWYVTDYAKKDQAGAGKDEGAKGEGAKAGDTAKAGDGSKTAGTDTKAGKDSTAGEKTSAAGSSTSPPAATKTSDTKAG